MCIFTYCFTPNIFLFKFAEEYIYLTVFSRNEVISNERYYELCKNKLQRKNKKSIGISLPRHIGVILVRAQSLF